MSPYAILGLSLLAVLATVILAFAFAPRPRKVGMHPALFAGYGRDDSLDDVHHRTLGGGRPPARASAKPKIFLTPRQLERVNIQRKLRNKAPLNQAGFANAAAHAWDQPRRQPDNSSDWLMYFVMYECFIADHQSHLVSASGSLTIDPNQPYNGQGGEFAGAGASGDWAHSDPYAALALTPAPDGTGGFAPLPPPSDSGSYSPGDTVGGYGSTPSVSDSSSSYSSSSDSSSSSSDSSSSSSSDSSSSSSSDGGGGGGGD